MKVNLVTTARGRKENCLCSYNAIICKFVVKTG